MTKDEYIQYLKQELAWYKRLSKSLFIALGIIVAFFIKFFVS
jgi:hypothetical protein